MGMIAYRTAWRRPEQGTRIGVGLLFLSFLLASAPGVCDEGFFLFDRVPREQIARAYGVQLVDSLLDRIEKSTLREGDDGTSGSLVSDHGLIITARHVIPPAARAAIFAALRDGFVADRPEQELRVPGMRFDAIASREDVTARLEPLVSDRSPQGIALLQEAIRSLERAATQDATHPAQVVELLGGRRYLLYRYQRYSDVRLVFAPAEALGEMRSSYPAPAFDLALVRVYEDGHPANTPVHLRLARGGPREGDFVMVAGAPYARSRRHLPVAELRFIRDIDLGLQHEVALKVNARLSALAARRERPDPGLDRALQQTGFLASYTGGALQDLRDPQGVAARVAAQASLVERMRSRGDAAGIASASQAEVLADAMGRSLAGATFLPFVGERDMAPWIPVDPDPPWAYAAGGRMLAAATLVLRAREERERPQSERNPGFGDAMQERRDAWLFSTACPDCPPITDRETEQTWLAAWLEALQETLPPDDPLVQVASGAKPARQRAQELLAASRMDDPAFRRAVFEAEDRALDTLADPLFDMVRALWPLARARAREFERMQAQLLEVDRAYVAALSRDDPMLYPDASTTVRLGYGRVQGWEQAERTPGDPPARKYPAQITLASVFEAPTTAGAPDTVQLPDYWQRARTHIAPGTQLDFLTSVDGFAGNSGSVTVNADGDVVGVLFGGAGGGAVFDLFWSGGFNHPERSIHASVSALWETLRRIDPSPMLVRELEKGTRNPVQARSKK